MSIPLPHLFAKAKEKRRLSPLLPCTRPVPGCAGRGSAGAPLLYLCWYRMRIELMTQIMATPVSANTAAHMLA